MIELSEGATALLFNKQATRKALLEPYNYVEREELLDNGLITRNVGRRTDLYRWMHTRDGIYHIEQLMNNIVARHAGVYTGPVISTITELVKIMSKAPEDYDQAIIFCGTESHIPVMTSNLSHRDMAEYHELIKGVPATYFCPYTYALLNGTTGKDFMYRIHPKLFYLANHRRYLRHVKGIDGMLYETDQRFWQGAMLKIRYGVGALILRSISEHDDTRFTRRFTVCNKALKNFVSMIKPVENGMVIE